MDQAKDRCNALIPLRTPQPVADQPIEQDPTILDTLSAAGVSANMPYRVWQYIANRQNVSVDPNYEPWNDIKGTPFEADPQRFAYSRNRDETMAIMAEANADGDAARVLSKSGWAGTASMVGMGMLDPTIFFPVAKVFSGAAEGVSILRTAADVAIAGAAGSAISEAGMKMTTPDMTMGDYAKNVGTATLLSGFLGAGAGAFATRAERNAIVAKLEQDRIDWTNDVSPSAQAAGAAASDTRNVQLVQTPLDKLPGGDPLGKITPTRRLLNSPFQSARRGLVDLAETAHIFEGNTEGVAVMNGPALDRLMKNNIRKARVGVSDVLENTFTRYRMGSGDPGMMQRAALMMQDYRGKTGGKLTRTEFKDAIDEALRNGDTHAIPEVAEAASYIRKNVLDPWKDRAIKAGLLPEHVEPETAASYMMRSWNKEKLTAQRPAAVQRFTDWLESEQTRKADIQQKLTGYARQLDEAEGKIAELERKAQGGSPEHIAAKAEVDKLYGLIEQGVTEWKGKSANEALSAIKARDKAAVGRDPSKPRLTAADSSTLKAMRKMIGADKNLSRQELSSRANEIVDRILGNPDGRLPYDGGSSGGGIPSGEARGPMASREFMIPDAMVREFLDTDIERTVHKYLNTMVPDVLMTERFGDVDMSETFRKLRDEHADLSAAAKTEKQRAELKDQYDAAVADLAAVRDRIRGLYGHTSDPRMRTWGRIASNLQRYNQLTDLGGVVLSSIPDMAGVVFHYGFAKTLKHQFAPLLAKLGSSDAKALTAAAKREMKAMAVGCETVLQSRMVANADLMDMYQPMSRFERGLDKVSNSFFIANMLSPWTDAMQHIAGSVAMDNFSRAIEASVAGKATKQQMRMLAESGIDSTMAGRIWSQMMTENGSNVVSGVRLSNSGSWADAGARDAWEGAITRDVDMTVMNPGQEKPLVMSRSPTAALLLQYKTFVVASTERILHRSLQVRDAQAAQGLFAAIALGMVGEYAYRMATGREMPDGIGNWTKAGLSRSGVLGWIDDGNAIASKWSNGQYDMYKAIGANDPGTRYQSRDKLGILLGPTVNKLDGVITAGMDALTVNEHGMSNWSSSDSRRLRRVVVFQNLFYIRRLIDGLGQE